MNKPSCSYSIAKNHLRLTIRCFFIFLFTSDLYANDSLRILTYLNDSTAVNACYQLGRSFYPHQKDSTFYYYNKGIDLADEINDFRGLVTILRSLGGVHTLEGNISEATRVLEEGIELIERHQLPDLEKLNFQINLGTAYQTSGNVDQALTIFYDAEDLAKELKVKDKQGMLLNNIGALFRSSQRYDEALEIYDRALVLKRSFKDSIGIGNVLLNKASTYGYMEKDSLAIYELNRAENIYKKLNSTSDLALVDLARASLFEKNHQLSKAITIYEGILNSDLSQFKLPHYIALYNGLGKSYYEEGRYADANETFEVIKPYIKSSSLSVHKSDYYKYYAKTKSELGQNAEAYSLLNEHVKIDDEIKSNHVIERLKEMETKYLTREKDLQIEMQFLSLKKANQQKWWLLAGLIGLGLISFLLYQLGLQRKSTSQQLQEKNTIISKALSEKEILLREIHHRVKNNLQFISSLLGLQSEHIEDAKALGILEEGQNRVQSMALIHQNLYQEDNLTGVDMKAYFIKLTRGLFDSYNIKKDQIQLHLEIENVNLDVDTVIPIGLIVNELVSNSLKYAFPGDRKGKINVGLKEVHDKLMLSVSDDGVGISTTQIDSLGKSFGYRLVHVFRDQLQAELTIDGTQGTSVTMSIKKYEKG